MASHAAGLDNELVEDLFEPVVRPTIERYETTDGMLDAVASRSKAMAWETWRVADLQDCYDSQVDFEAMAAARRLTVLKLPNDGGALGVPLVSVYAFHPENLWRVAAHEALKAIHRNGLLWSWDAEEMQSFLLGYTDEERRIWHEYNDWRQMGWGGLTVYFLMNQHSYERTSALAARCLDPTLGEQGIVMAFPPGEMAVKKDGLTRMPPHTFLARTAIRHDSLDALLGPASARPQTPIQARTLTRELIDNTNRALVVSKLQFLTVDGWR